MLTIGSLVDRAAELSGGGIVMPAERASAAEFAALTRTMARRLVAAGVTHGERVGLLNTDRIESLALLFGAMRIGAVPVPVNARYKARELSYVVDNAGMHTLILDAEFASLLEDAALPASCQVIVGLDTPSFTAGGESVDESALAQIEEPCNPTTRRSSSTPRARLEPEGLCLRPPRDDDAVVQLRRGARPHGRRPLLDAAAPVPRGRPRHPARHLAARCPLVHVGRHFVPDVALEMLERERCTLAFPAFETIWLAVQNEPGFAEADLSALRLVIAVGSPGALRILQERLPSVPQVSSSAARNAAASSRSGGPTDPLETRLTTNGSAFPGSELRVVDPETGEDLPPDTTGEILMRGPARSSATTMSPS